MHPSILPLPANTHDTYHFHFLYTQASFLRHRCVRTACSPEDRVQLCSAFRTFHIAAVTAMQLRSSLNTASLVSLSVALIAAIWLARVLYRGLSLRLKFRAMQARGLVRYQLQVPSKEARSQARDKKDSSCAESSSTTLTEN